MITSKYERRKHVVEIRDDTDGSLRSDESGVGLDAIVRWPKDRCLDWVVNFVQTMGD